MWFDVTWMARRKRSQSSPSARVVEAHEAGKTQRSWARWDALKRIIPATVASGAAAWSASQAAGHASQFNVILVTLVCVGTPSALTKILWDRFQKRRLRAANQSLEEENRTLTRQTGELDGQIMELRRQLGHGTPVGRRDP